MNKIVFILIILFYFTSCHQNKSNIFNSPEEATKFRMKSANVCELEKLTYSLNKDSSDFTRLESQELFKYDIDGNLIEFRELGFRENPNLFEYVKYFQYDSGGLLIKSKDHGRIGPDSQTTEYIYNGKYLTAKVTSWLLDNTIRYIIIYKYNKDGYLYEEIRYDQAYEEPMKLYTKVVYEYDNAGKNRKGTQFICNDPEPLSFRPWLRLFQPFGDGYIEGSDSSYCEYDSRGLLILEVELNDQHFSFGLYRQRVYKFNELGNPMECLIISKRTKSSNDSSMVKEIYNYKYYGSQ